MNTAERVIAILNYLAINQASRGVTEISRELGSGKSTVYRVLSSLESVQWVAQDSETDKYTLGSMALEFSLSLLNNFDVRKVSLRYLEELRDATGETSMLSLRVGLERIYVEQLPSHNEVRHFVQLGIRVPLWCGAPSKVMLAYMEENEVGVVMENLRKSGVTILASGQAVDSDSLREELANISRQGFAVTVGERVAAVAGVAAPIFDRHHRVVGAISVSGPLPRFSADLATSYGPLVGQAASKISLQVGDSKENAATDR